MALNRHDASAEKMAIAEQVIVSAGNILVAAGFQRDEIAAFFRQAADHLAPLKADGGAGPAPAMPDVGQGRDIRSNFRSIAPVRTLAGLMAEAAAMDQPHTSPEALKQGFDLAMKMVPHIAEAQNWLRGAADRAGLAIAPNRREWMEGRSNDEGDTIFLEEFEAAYKPNYDLIQSVTHALVEQADEQALLLLLVSLVDNNISVNYELKNAIEAGVKSLGQKAPSDE